MHITILALGSRGDIQPYATLGKGLKAEGHRFGSLPLRVLPRLVAENELDLHPIQGNAQALVANAGADILPLFGRFGSLAQGYGQRFCRALPGRNRPDHQSVTRWTVWF